MLVERPIQQTSTTHTIIHCTLTLCLLFCIAIHGCNAGIAHRKMHRAKFNPVPDCYFVHFKPSTNSSTTRALLDEMEQLDRDSSQPEFSVFVQGVMTEVVNGFAVKMSSEALHFVLKQDSVNFVEEDSYVYSGQLRNMQSSNTRTVGSWGTDRMDQDTNLYNGKYTPPCGLTGRDVDVYVLDSGIRYNHVQFGGRAKYGCDVIDQITNSSTPRRGNDCHGHGTSVAGIIGSSLNGVAPGANLISVRVLDCQNSGSWNSILAGLECLLNRVKENKDRSSVVSISVYGASKNRAIKSAIDKLIDNGISVVALSGNTRVDRSGNSCKVAPGSIPSVITVAGSTRSDEPYNHTLMGRCVDILAPAKDIVSTSASCSVCRATHLAGSSFAVPHVTGAIALLLEKCPRLPPWKVRHYLLTRMVLFDKLQMKHIISRKYRLTTPNLLIHTGSEMCTIEC